MTLGKYPTEETWGHGTAFKFHGNIFDEDSTSLCQAYRKDNLVFSNLYHQQLLGVYNQMIF